MLSDWDTPVQHGVAYSLRHRPSGQTYYCPTYDDVARLLTGSPPRRRSRLLAWWRYHRRGLAIIASWALVIFLANVEARLVVHVLSPPVVETKLAASPPAKQTSVSAGDQLLLTNLDARLTWRDDPRWRPGAPGGDEDMRRRKTYATALVKARRAKPLRIR